VYLGKVAICLQKTETRSMPATLNSKWSKDLNFLPETLQLISAGKSREYPGNNKYR
jgi:hypothetical protein